MSTGYSSVYFLGDYMEINLDIELLETVVYDIKGFACDKAKELGEDIDKIDAVLSLGCFEYSHNDDTYKGLEALKQDMLIELHSWVHLRERLISLLAKKQS